MPTRISPVYIQQRTRVYINDLKTRRVIAEVF